MPNPAHATVPGKAVLAAAGKSLGRITEIKVEPGRQTVLFELGQVNLNEHGPMEVFSTLGP